MVFKTCQRKLCSNITHTLWDRRNEDDSKVFEHEFQKPEWFTGQFLRAMNIRRVRLYLDYDNNPVAHRDICRWLTQFPFWLEGFKRLSKLIVDVPISFEVDGPRLQRIRDALMARVLRKVGVQGKCVRISPRRRESVEIWSWEAADGQLMDWSQSLGTIWKHPPLSLYWVGWADEMPWDLFRQADYGDRLGMRNGQFVILGCEDADEE